jgi:lactate dehydrogenase-like 2-hydroxyacid dehydrogenase
MAFDSIEAVERILDTTVENIKSFFEGKNYHKVI